MTGGDSVRQWENRFSAPARASHRALGGLDRSTATLTATAVSLGSWLWSLCTGTARVVDQELLRTTL